MTVEHQRQPAAGAASPASGRAVRSRQKVVVFLQMLLLLYVIEGLTLLLRVTPRFFPAEKLKESVWIVLYEQHFWQLVLALICIKFLSEGKFSDWGFNLRNAGVTWRIFWKFCVVYSVVIFLVNVLPALSAHEPPVFDYPLTRENVVGWLTFEWIFVGISEEIMFRGLIHTYLARTWRGVWHIGNFAFPTAGLGATILFCLAHVDILHMHVNWWQQVFAFGLGIYYSAAYHRTQSLLGPILSHNFGDGIIFAALYILYWHLH